LQRERLLRFRRFGIRRRAYARFYGRYKAKTGDVKGFEFQVAVSSALSPKALYKLIAHTCGKMLYENVLPVHKKGQTFPNFQTLFRSLWVEIREVLDYDVNMRY